MQEFPVPGPAARSSSPQPQRTKDRAPPVSQPPAALVADVTRKCSGRGGASKRRRASGRAPAGRWVWKAGRKRSSLRDGVPLSLHVGPAVHQAHSSATAVDAEDLNPRDDDERRKKRWRAAVDPVLGGP